MVKQKVYNTAMDRSNFEPNYESIVGEKLRPLLSLPKRKGKHKKITISGIPGSGKTTMSRMLADYLQGIYIKEFLDLLPKHVLDMREHSTVEQQILAQQWILSQYKMKAELIKQMPRGSIIVKDRGVIDCLAYSAVCKPKVLDVIREESEAFDWPSVFTIILIADDATIKERMVSREGFTEEFFHTNWRTYVQNLRGKYLSIAQELSIPVIDTSNKTSKTTLRNLLSLING